MNKKVLVIDNYDSFVYNLVHYLEEFDADVSVYRNDQIDLKSIEHFDKILLSPGPGIPDEAGLLKTIIREYADRKPILGVCLGLQAIVEVYGGTLKNLEQVYHGISTPAKLIVQDDLLFKGIPENFEIGRYHSWCSSQKVPDILEVTAIDHSNEVMAIRHKTLPIHAVQFHPESILTAHGKQMIKNWINS
ncbi:MAG: aminodeoxychorismate/anthranilate synthase component II [Psychroflexus sp.]|nr:aminodeoxychorismate/anthranilate synthase component II [Psychroflexus sp.]MDN6310132.1 aminodeoxychorismate/anthranilate synthase component II [Psychroflexus sp.]